MESDPARWSRRVALVVAAAFFMEQVDATILATAAPVIAGDFEVRPADVGIAMTAYIAAVAAFIPASGWAADRFGARRVFLAAIALFVAASIACGFSSSLEMLTIVRVVQGIAGSMLVPIGRLIVLASVQKSDLIRAVAYITWPALAAPVIAPFLGGVLTQYAGWPWIFFINVPLGLALLIWAAIVLPASEPAPPRAFDLRGFAFAGIAIAALVLGLESIAGAFGNFLLASILLGVAAAMIPLAVWWSRRAPAPLLDFRAFRHPTFRNTNVSGIVWRTTVSSAPFLLPLLLQDGFGWTPVEAGLMVMWVFVGNLGIKPVTTPLLRRFGFVTVIVGSAVGLAATFVGCAFLTPETPLVVVAAIFLLSGIFRSTGFTAYATLQFADVPQGEMSGANTIASTLVQLATALGIALAAVAIRVVDAVVAAEATDALPADPLLPYRVALLLMAALAIGSMFGSLRLPPGAGAHVRGPRPAVSTRKAG